MGTRDLRTLWRPPVSLNQVGHTQRCKSAIFFFNFFFVTKICWKVPHENIHGEASFYVLHNVHLCVRPHTRRRDQWPVRKWLWNVYLYVRPHTRRRDRWLHLVSVETTREKGRKEKKKKKKPSRTDTGPRFYRNYAGKGRKKKTIMDRQPAGKWPKKNRNYTGKGQPARKGRKPKKKKSCPFVGRGPKTQRTRLRWTDGQGN